MARQRSEHPRVRLKVGDVIEFTTKKGLAYAQCTHTDPDMGPLLRVLPGFSSSRPEDMTEVLAQLPVYSVYVITPVELDPDVTRLIGNYPVPEHSQALPVFRNGVVDPRTRRVNCWWLCDGEKEWRVDRLTEEQKRLSILRIQYIARVAHDIERGWSPLDFT